MIYLVFVCVVFIIAAVRGDESLLQYVNVLGGSDSKMDMSSGSTIPMVTRPWGATAWVPQTNTNDNMWWFHPRERMFYGMRCTHQPSPWINDYGQFLIQANLPYTSSGSSDSTGKVWAGGYSPLAKTSTFSPNYFKTNLLGFMTSIEFTADRHAGIMRIKFPEARAEAAVETNTDGTATVSTDLTRRVQVVLNGGSDFSQVVDIDGAAYITGYSTANSGGVPPSIPFKHYFAVGIYTGKNGNIPVPLPKASQASSSLAYVDVSADISEVTLRVGVSFISPEQALLNLNREAGMTTTFEDMKKAGADEWEKQLGKTRINSVGAKYTQNVQEQLKEVFYTAAYRASIFPRQLSEIDAHGKEVHWSPYTFNADPTNPTNVYPGPVSTDSGFWDAYTTIYPYHSLVNLDVLGPKIMHGWLNAFKEGGWLPKWASPGYRSGMVATMGDVSFADAIVNDIPGLDAELSYEAIRKNAFESPPQGVNGIGRVCLDSYLEHGYIPNDVSMTTGGECYEVVSRTLNYMQSDWSIAQAAKKLGKTSDYEILMARAGNYSVLFDGKSNPAGFFRSKDQKGKHPVKWDSIQWGGDYTEAGPHQYRFYVPWDAQGLKELYERNHLDMCQELRNTMTTNGDFHIGDYGYEIHEQTEMTFNCWGQYEHNNQPVHHMLWMFGGYDEDGTGTTTSPTYTRACSQSGQYYLRRTLQELYKPGLDMFPGDEDNGQMSAWYLLSSLGLYEIKPGSGKYSLGSPLFEDVTIRISAANSLSSSVLVQLHITAINQGPNNVYVHRVEFNDKVLTEGQISYSELIQGGVLKFIMSDVPTN